MYAQPLFDWMQERERIRQKRAAGQPPPWTDDPILARGYFTNVMREHDKVSVWIQANITDVFSGDSTLPLKLGLARHLNRITTLNEMAFAGLWAGVGTEAGDELVLAFLEDLPRPIYGGGYVISAAGMAYGTYQTKEEYVQRVVGQLAQLQPWPLSSLEEFVHQAKGLPGWGAFMAYEVACDLRWAPGWLDAAPDIYSWANPGPGARRGVHQLTGLPVNYGRALAAMRELLELAQVVPWAVQWPRPLEMRDIEHSLCEFQKYERAQRTGRMKRWYR